MIDYKQGRDRLLENTKELGSERGLKMLYTADAMFGRAPLRLIHVQNAEWAKGFFRERFQLGSDEAVEEILFNNEEQHHPKRSVPILQARSSGMQSKAFRSIKAAAFRWDYLRPYNSNLTVRPFDGEGPEPWLWLRDQHAPAYEVYVERVAVYVQSTYNNPKAKDQSMKPATKTEAFQNLKRKSDIARSMTSALEVNAPDTETFTKYKRSPPITREVEGISKTDKHKTDALKANPSEADRSEAVPLKSDPSRVEPPGMTAPRKTIDGSQRFQDNGNTIILFSDAVKGSKRDTLVGARRALEDQWRRLSVVANKSGKLDDAFIADCMDSALKSISDTIASNWDQFLHICERHVGTLEEKGIHWPVRSIDEANMLCVQSTGTLRMIRKPWDF